MTALTVPTGAVAAPHTGTTAGAAAPAGGLELRTVSLAYPDGDGGSVIALDDVSLSVAPGELVAVVGPSGSGKSSLLAVAGLLRRPDRGRVIVGGVDTTDASDADHTTMRRDRIGFVFQSAGLVASLDALDQVLLAAHVAGRRPSEVKAEARELLDAVGIAAAQQRRRPAQLSGGQRQRVAIARALVNRPDVILADEPTSALDHERGAEVMALLRRTTAERNVAGIVVTHDTSQLAVVDRIVTVHDGVLAHS